MNNSLINFDLIDPQEVDYKLIASEIVRGMTNSNLSQDQQKALNYVVKVVLSNHLQNKTPTYTITKEGKYGNQRS